MQFEFSLSIDLFDNFINIIDLNSSLKSIDIPQKILDEFLIDEFKILGKILNINYDAKDIRAYALGFSKISSSFDSSIASGYRNSNEMIQSLYVDKGNIFTLNIISRVNKVLTENGFEIWESGKLRNEKFPYNGELDFFKLESLILDKDIYDNIYKIANYYKNDKYPNIIKVFVISYNLFRLKPFCVLNDITIVIIMKILLFDIDFFNYVQILNIFYENIDKLNPDIDLSEWLLNMSKFLLSDMKSQNEYIRKYISLDHRKFLSNNIIAKLNDRQKNIFFYLREHKNISRQEYMRLFKISSMTAFRDLNEMKSLGVITSFGSGRGTRYTILEKFLT